MKFIHYTEKDEYLRNPRFTSCFSEIYPITKDKLHPQEIGMLGGRIAVKKLTKKEREEEWNKHIKEIYKYLEEKNIPFLKKYKETKKKVLVCKFLGIELWIDNWRYSR